MQDLMLVAVRQATQQLEHEDLGKTGKRERDKEQMRGTLKGCFVLQNIP